MDKEIPQRWTYHEESDIHKCYNTQRLIGPKPCEGAAQAAESGRMSGNGGDVWKSYEDRGEENKAACVCVRV